MNKLYRTALTLFALVALLFALPTLAQERHTCPANGRLKIFIVAGQSNMVGFGTVEGADTPGTMQYHVRTNPDAYGHLVGADGNPVVRDDVYLVNISNPNEPRSGFLTTGFGASAGHIGPEYAFGFAVGDYYQDPVLIIKCAWGGKSLSNDFLPPSAGNYPAPQQPGDAGYYYAQVVQQVRQITANIGDYVPGYTNRGYDIVGFGWHQGWNDRINQDAVNAYESNMAHFISDMRRDLGIEALPFVIANTGMGGWDIPASAPYKAKVEQLMEAQLALANAERHPEFAGTVAGVETRDFQRTREQSPSGQEFHWNRNWETYYLIGTSMGEAIIELVDED